MSLAPSAAILLLGTSCCAWAADQAAADPDPWWTRERRLVALNLALDLGVVGYGFAAWDWGSTSPRATSEGWFGAGTPHGGADKVGHAYTGFLIGSLLADRYLAWGYGREEAAAYGALSSLVFTSLIEVGDGLSRDYGFSGEDLAMNAAGAVFGWLRGRSPLLAGLLDFRIQYLPSSAVRHGETADLVTDYDGMRHLLAFTPAGLPGWEDHWLRFVELHVGYYTRGYDDAGRGDRRVLYGAIGLNVGEVVAALWGRSAVFDYYQPPWTYLPVPHGPGD